MAAVTQAAGQAKTRSAQVGQNAARRRKFVANTSGTTFKAPGDAAQRRDINSRTNSDYRASPQSGGVSRRGTRSAPRTTKGRGSSFAAGAAAGDVYQRISPTNAGEKTGSAIGGLEAEFLGALALLLLTIFTDTASYSDKMLAVMKRGTLVCITFFILALTAGMGPNAARFAKAFGALIDVGILLSVGSTTMIQELDAFFKADWASVGTGGANSNQAQAGQSGLGGVFGAIGAAVQAKGQQIAQGAGNVANATGAASTVIGSNPFLEGNPAESIAGGVSRGISDVAGGIRNVFHSIFGGKG